MEFSILLIDDEKPQRLSLSRFLNRRGYLVFTAADGESGFKVVQQETIDLVITDFRMPGWSGLDTLNRIKDLNPDVEVVVLTAFGNVEDAVSIMKAGAYDYLSKPVDLEELSALVERVREKRNLITENRELRTQLAERFRFESIISGSSLMEEALNLAGRIATSKTTAIIRGESGTGKELVARAIHQASPRRDKRFDVVHLAAINEDLVESELFGHEKGAFTGANSRRIGRLERVSGGTVLFDEIGDVPLSIQVKLLRVLQFGELQRVGGNETIPIDVRILAATHRNLEEMIADGSFREDLYYRLNVVSIWLPPLRKRKADIAPLVDYFVSKFATANEKSISGISREAMDQLLKYDYPGNVRELENIMERAVVLARDSLIVKSDLPAHMIGSDAVTTTEPNPEAGYEEQMTQFETELLNRALEQTDMNQSAASRLLGITERHLRYRLARLKGK